MRHEVQVGEGRAKIRAVNIGLSCRLGKVQAVTSRTKHINRVVAGQIGQSDGQHWLTLTKNVGTTTKMAHAVFFVHGVHAPIGDNVPGFFFFLSLEIEVNEQKLSKNATCSVEPNGKSKEGKKSTRNRPSSGRWVSKNKMDTTSNEKQRQRQATNVPGVDETV
jgi:hypothetical protein